jgi:hypothetical protein
VALGLAALCPLAHAAVAECPPAALVEGPPATVGAVGEDLRQRGIATTPAGACPFVRAQLFPGADGIVVAIVDTSGRSSVRTAGNPRGAATIIESWTRTDIVEPLLTPHSAADAAALPPRADEASLSLAAASRPPRSGPPFASLTSRAEASVATDGSLWFGVSMGVCLRIGPACAGALARVSHDSGVSGDSEDFDNSRLATDVQLGAELPLESGRLTFTPGVSLGVGWMRTSGTGTSNGGTVTIDEDSGGLLAGASTRLSFALSADVGLDAGLEADVMPLAHPAPRDVKVTVLAGQPRGYVRGGLGMRVDLP